MVPVIGIFFLLLSGCFLIPREEKLLEPPLVTPQEIKFDEIAVRRGDIVNKMEVLAYFQYLDEHGLYFRYRGGPLKAFHATLGDYVTEGELLAELELGTLDIQIRQKQLALEKANLQLERLRLSGGDKFQIRMAEIDREVVELQLSELEATLQYGQIRAPFDGVITFRDRLFEGDRVGAYEPILRIADSNKLSLVYQGSRIGDFRPGMDVDVVVDNAELAGKVVMTAQNVPETANPDLKKLVVFEVEDLPASVERGSQAIVRVELSRKNDVLIVPSNVVHSYMGNTFVNILRDGIKKEQPVEVGIKTNTQTEITEGLTEGDTVIW